MVQWGQRSEEHSAEVGGHRFMIQWWGSIGGGASMWHAVRGVEVTGHFHAACTMCDPQGVWPLAA